MKKVSFVVSVLLLVVFAGSGFCAVESKPAKDSRTQVLKDVDAAKRVEADKRMKEKARLSKLAIIERLVETDKLTTAEGELKHALKVHPNDPAFMKLDEKIKAKKAKGVKLAPVAAMEPVDVKVNNGTWGKK